MTEYVVLVAFTVDNANTFRGAQEALTERLHPLLESQDPSSPITSWWVADDERYDGSDCDSAVFVTPGNQPAASEILYAAGLTPDYNVSTRVSGAFEPMLDDEDVCEITSAVVKARA